MKYLIPLLLAFSVHAADFSVTAGKMLNNTDQGQSGMIYGVELHHFWGAHGARFNYQYVNDTSLAEDMAYSSLSFIERRGRLTYGVGIISQMSYSRWGWWEGRHYPNDGQLFSQSCRWCGSIYSVDVALNNRWATRLLYIAQNKLEHPTYNGYTLALEYRL